MSVGSAQEQWLRADLAANSKPGTLAYWHRPRFTSGTVHSNATDTQPLWQALQDYGADIILSGHVHNYERFALQTANGTADAVRGIREFVVGTGGALLYASGTPIANSQVRNDNTFGVLKLTLGLGTYSWQFVPIAGQTFTDSGSGVCHNAGASDTTSPATVTDLRARRQASCTRLGIDRAGREGIGPCVGRPTRSRADATLPSPPIGCAIASSRMTSRPSSCPPARRRDGSASRCPIGARRCPTRRTLAGALQPERPCLSPAHERAPRRDRSCRRVGAELTAHTSVSLAVFLRPSNELFLLWANLYSKAVAVRATIGQDGSASA